MCTVTYLPGSNGDFIFTTNRDEAPKRSASGIIQGKSPTGKSLLFPKDQLASGTWIAVSDTHQLVCILNGAFIKHKHQPPYRLSRGIMALQFFDFENADHFFTAFDFEGIEPFTMVIFDKGQLYDLHWDEKSPVVEKLAVDQSHIWSSCTLYPPEQQAKRIRWFEDWRNAQANFTKENILQFHKTGGDGDPWNDLVMNRDGVVRTVSITSVEKKSDSMEMSYHDLIEKETAIENIISTIHLR